MSCPNCVSSLSGVDFTTTGVPSAPDFTTTAYPELEVPDELVSNMKGALGLLLGVPLTLSIAGAVAGAVGWRSHRVIGGVLGWFGGGLVGTAIGASLARGKIENDVLPGIEQLADQIEAQAPAEGPLQIQPGQPNSAGPLRTNTPVSAPKPLVAPVLPTAIGKAMGVPTNSIAGKAAQTLVGAVLGPSKTSLTTVTVTKVAPTTADPRTAPRTAPLVDQGPSPMPTNTNYPTTKPYVPPSPIALPKPLPQPSPLPLTQVKLASQTVGEATGTPAKTDVTNGVTHLSSGQRMPLLAM